jgi:hypothetical protein
MIEIVLLKRSPCDLQGSESVLSFIGVPRYAYSIEPNRLRRGAIRPITAIGGLQDSISMMLLEEIVLSYGANCPINPIA